MSRELDELADGLPLSERTLRRWVNDGLLRGRRVGASRLSLSPGERQYVRRAGRLLSDLRRRLRTERAVRFAVLFGSTAVGEDRPDSDIDILVQLRDNDPFARVRIAARLERVVRRRVQLVTLDEAEESPLLLADVIEEGRVLVDRDAVWSPLQARRARILDAARRRDADLTRRARAAVDYLTR